MKNTKITPKQTVFLVLSCTLSSVHVFLPNQMTLIASRDAWISALLASIIGGLIFFTVVKLCMLMPNYSLATINKKLLGKYFGGLLTSVYIISFLTLCIRGLIQFAVIMTVSFKPESAPHVWHLLILIPALYVAFLGISVSARMNEIILPVGFTLIIMLIMLDIPNMNFKEYLPVLQHGYKPPLMGAAFAGGHLAYSIIILALMPLINKKEKLITTGIPLFVLVTTTSLLIAVLSIAIVGLMPTKAWLLPSLIIIRAINIGFFSRLELILITIWQMGFFVLVSVFIYSAATLTRDMFSFKGYRIILLIYGVLVFIGANIYITNVSLLRELFLYPLTILFYVLGLAIPLMLYALAKLKGYPKKQGSSQRSK
jgi:spore germination protein KB